jgi:hypothetical protein
MDDRRGSESRDRMPARRRNDDEYEYDSYPRRRPYPPRPRPRPRPRRRRRRVWPVLLTGCLIGILVSVIAAAVVVFTAFRVSQGQGIGIGPVGNSTRTFTHEDTTQVPLSTLSQLQICDKIGDVSIKVDPNATMATVTSKKVVHKSSQSDANQAFGRISVEVQPPGTITNPLTCTKLQVTPTPPAASAASASPTASSTTTAGDTNSTLIVNVTQPNSDSFMRTTSDEVDLSLTLPQKALPQEVASMLLDIEAPVGNIMVDGVSGLLQISGSTGNVTVSHVVLAPGSQIEAAQGDVTFNGWLLPPDPPDTNARYVLQSEKGNIDVTLPDNTNVTLDANTNVGAVHSEFPLTVNNNGGPVNYHGPLNSSASSQATATLYLDVSTGNISIHKSQA